MGIILPADTDRTWSLVLSAAHELTSFPLAQMPVGATSCGTVSVIKRDDVPRGELEQVRHIRENAQEFDVSYYRFPECPGLLHGRGGNWILWSNDQSSFFVTENANDPAQTWIHTRFILRHLIVDHFLMQTGFRRIHAAAGTLLDGSGLIIAGPYLSGKTYLLNALLKHGLLLDWVEDDCVVVDADWTLHALIPTPETVCEIRKLRLSIMVCLDKSCVEAERITTEEAMGWALSIQASWPVSWLPHHSTISISVPEFKRELFCMRVPERPAPEDVISLLTRYAESKIE